GGVFHGALFLRIHEASLHRRSELRRSGNRRECSVGDDPGPVGAQGIREFIALGRSLLRSLRRRAAGGLMCFLSPWYASQRRDISYSPSPPASGICAARGAPAFTRIPAYPY